MSAAKPGIAVVMLVGGSGKLNIDANGCLRRLNGNILVRSAPLLGQAGIDTVFLDTPSDWVAEDGLAGFRIHPDHAADIGRVVADVRVRRGVRAVWLMGHSRGTLSAVNAATRLFGPEAPDGVVLVSAMMSGEGARRKAWAAQTVFDMPLKSYRGPLLVVGQAADNCLRSPPDRMDAVVKGSSAVRQQVVRMTGGPFAIGRAPSLLACETLEPHDLVEQDAELSAGVVRFIRGGLF